MRLEKVQFLYCGNFLYLYLIILSRGHTLVAAACLLLACCLPAAYACLPAAYACCCSLAAAACLLLLACCCLHAAACLLLLACCDVHQGRGQLSRSLSYPASDYELESNQPETYTFPLFAGVSSPYLPPAPNKATETDCYFLFW